jgi:hypothetical protein
MQTKTFVVAVVIIGFAGMAFADGYSERARSIFLNEVQKSYAETKDQLASGNTDAAKDSCKQLHESVRKLVDQVGPAKEILATLGDTPVMKAWEDVDHSSRELNANVGLLEGAIGKADAKDSLSNVTKVLEDLGRAMDKANSAFTDFGKRWQSVCDTCK